MSTQETKSAIQADRAWSDLTRTLGHGVPYHLHNAQVSWRKMQHLRRKG